MEYRPGADIFTMDVDCIINPINCKVHILEDRRKPQKGLAGAFEQKFPELLPVLAESCRKGLMKPGGVQMVKFDRSTAQRDRNGDLTIANLATKDYWGDPSKIEWVDDGLRKLASAVESRGIKSIAIPMLGAAYGQLPWSQVCKSIEKHFRPLSEKGVSITVLGEEPAQSRNGANTSKSVAAPAPTNALASLPTPLPDDGFIRYAGIGARDTPDYVNKKMVKIGEILAREGWILRSGAAKGADSAFEKGADRVDGRKKEIFLPWNGFDPLRDGNKRYSDGKSVFSDEPSTLHFDLAAAYHPKFSELTSGVRNLMARNGSQMLGRNLDRPTNLVICWTPDGKITGGTGQALRMAEDVGAKVLNLGDPRLKQVPAENLSRMAKAIVSGEEPEQAITAEKRRLKKELEAAR